MIKKQYLVSLSALLFFLSACGSAPNSSIGEGEPGRKIVVAGGEFTEISIAEFQTMQDEKDFLLVNVHIPYEGDLPGTDISFPFNEIQQNLSLLPEDKNAKMVLYCRSDRMSGIAAEELVSLGYTNIWNLDGGINAWIQAGLPLAID